MIYNLPTITLPDTVPGWAKLIGANEQTMADARYKAAVDAYYSMAQIWIDTNTAARAASANPAQYTPTSFDHAIPARLEFTDWDVNANPNGGGDWVTVNWVDPNIHPPALPAYVAPVNPPTNPGRIATGNPTAQPASDSAFQATMVQMLMQHTALLNQILAKLGA